MRTRSGLGHLVDRLRRGIVAVVAVKNVYERQRVQTTLLLQHVANVLWVVRVGDVGNDTTVLLHRQRHATHQQTLTVRTNQLRGGLLGAVVHLHRRDGAGDGLTLRNRNALLHSWNDDIGKRVVQFGRSAQRLDSGRRLYERVEEVGERDRRRGENELLLSGQPLALVLELHVDLFLELAILLLLVLLVLTVQIAELVARVVLHVLHKRPALHALHLVARHAQVQTEVLQLLLGLLSQIGEFLGLRCLLDIHLRGQFLAGVRVVRMDDALLCGLSLAVAQTLAVKRDIGEHFRREEHVHFSKGLAEENGTVQVDTLREDHACLFLSISERHEMYLDDGTDVLVAQIPGSSMDALHEEVGSFHPAVQNALHVLVEALHQHVIAGFLAVHALHVVATDLRGRQLNLLLREVLQILQILLHS